MGKDNEATGFNDQSKNIQQQAVTPTPTQPPTQPPTPTPKTCIECFTSLLSTEQIQNFQTEAGITIGEICQGVESGTLRADLSSFVDDLDEAGVSPEITIELVKCLQDAGIVFI